MMDYLPFLALFLSLFGLGMLVHHKLDIHPAFIPIFIFSTITSIVFLAGLINFMPEMVHLIFLIGLLLCGVYISLAFTGRYVPQNLVVPSTVIFFILTVIVMFMVKGLILLNYDNFSHWGLIVKEMFTVNGLPDSRTVIEYKNYPPGSAVFIFFINQIIGYSESHTLMAQGYLLMSNLAVLLVFCKWRNPAHILLSLISGFTLLIVIKSDIYNLLVDTLLGLVALSITVIAYYYRKNWLKSILVNTPLLVLLILVKDSGKLFFFFNIAFIVFFIFSNQIRGLKLKPSQAKILAFVLLFAIFIPLFTNFLWIDYTENAYPNTSYEENKFAVTVNRFSNMEKSEEAINNLLPDLLNASFNPTANSNVKSLLLLNSVSILSMMIVYIRRKMLPKRLFGSTLLINFYYVIYIGFLYLMYLFLMPEGEMSYLAGFDRYQSTIVIYCIGILMTAMILEWSMIAGIQKNKALKLITMGFLIVVFVYPFHEHISSIVTKPEVESSLRLEVKNNYDIIRDSGTQNPNVLYYSHDSMDDRGYLRNMVLYEQLSWNFHISYSVNTEAKKESFLKEMKVADYIVVLDTNDTFKAFFSDYVRTKNLEGVYKVIHKENQLQAIPLN